MILVSACLLGDPCKYNGGTNKNEAVLRFLQGKCYCRICPETAGGLTIPRLPAERRGQRVVQSDGTDVTDSFMLGAKKTLETARRLSPELIILKANSPSCGVGSIYNGYFCKALCKGNGVAAQMLLDAGFTVTTEKELKAWKNDCNIFTND